MKMLKSKCVSFVCLMNKGHNEWSVYVSMVRFPFIITTAFTLIYFCVNRNINIKSCKWFYSLFLERKMWSTAQVIRSKRDVLVITGWWWAIRHYIWIFIPALGYHSMRYVCCMYFVLSCKRGLYILIKYVYFLSYLFFPINTDTYTSIDLRAFSILTHSNNQHSTLQN